MPYIPLYSNSSMQGAGRQKIFLKYDLPREVTVVDIGMVLRTTTCLGLKRPS